MVTVNGKTVTMTKGDTVVLTVKIQDGDGEYTPQQGDKVRFAMKKRYTDATPLILKEIPLDTMELRIDPEDTKNLDAGESRGKYYFDVELTKADGTVDTFIPRGEWLVLEEVY